MKIEITAGGIFGKDGEIPVGTELTVKDEPVAWKGRYRVIGKTDGKTPVTNDGPKPYNEMSRAELDKLADERKVDVKDAKNKGDIIAALQLADEAAKTA